MNRNVLLVIFIVLVLVVLEFAVLLGYQKIKSAEKAEPQSQPVAQNKNESPFDSPVFSSQNATVEGEITHQAEGNNIEVKNKQGIISSFPASPKMVIYKYNSRSSEASASSDLKSLEVNAPAIIALEYWKGQYQIVAISFPSTKLSNK